MKNIGRWKEEYKKHGTLPDLLSKPWFKKKAKTIVKDITKTPPPEWSSKEYEAVLAITDNGEFAVVGNLYNVDGAWECEISCHTFKNVTHWVRIEDVLELLGFKQEG